MAFVWKDRKEIFKGEGIYHLTFVVAGRRRLFGELLPLDESRTYNGGVQRYYATEDKALYTSKLAATDLSLFGFSVLKHLQQLPNRYGDDSDRVVVICAKQFMPDHLHVVVWIKKELDRSIRQIAQGFRIGVRRIAEDMGLWKREDGHVLDVPFIRTLSHGGQLRQMIDYVHANPDNAWMRKMNPDMYVLRRNHEYGGLGFDAMGKARLLDYPQRNVVALSRSLTKEQIADEVNRALRLAERGAVTYCAAMNDGEKAVTRAVREAGFPLVVMLLDGFPPEGSEAERYFHPGGAYHKACGEGRLCLMAPLGRNYEDGRLIELTELELARKAEEKGMRYDGIPHSSLRWRMIAGNVMLGIIAGELA